MISLKEVEEIHRILINNFGGSHGVRDLGALESSLARPFQKFDNKELYSTVILKAAALLESLLINHPSIDGNKGTGYTLTLFSFVPCPFLLILHHDTIFYNLLKINIAFIIT